MSSHVTSRRTSRRCSRGKMVLDVDLNDPPIENCMPEGTSVPLHSAAPQGAAAVNPHHGRSSGHQQMAIPPANNGLHGSPIDVEEIEDDVLLLSSSRGFRQSRNQSRRNRPVTVVLDEDVEIHSGRSGTTLREHPAALSHNSNPNKRRRVPANRTIINCETYMNLEDDDNAKKKNVVNSHPQPQILVPKEPTFSCPICLNALVEAASTICGHVFCHSCIKASMQVQKKCPTCRRKLTMNNFHRVYLPTTN